LRQRKSFVFSNAEGRRRSKADVWAIAFRPPAEAAGDFSQSGVDIFNPFRVRPNPNFDPSKPASAANPRMLRDQFPNNRIPAEMISPVASIMLNRYVPRPNRAGASGMGMTMNGVPQVFGAGLDANNYLDIRGEHQTHDQGTLRIDRIFQGGDSVFGRYSIGAENGFMPQNLPGFGTSHENLSQQ